MLLDTSGLLCLHHQAEALHEEACQAYRASATRLTHCYVLAEFIALAQSRRIPRPAAIEFVTDLVANSHIQTVWV